MEQQYIASMMLAAVGDTIGFKNGDWEFDKGNWPFSQLDELYDFSDTLVFDFIDLGGVNKISLKDWFVSDDTLMHMATAKALLQSNILNEMAREYILSMKEMNTKKINRQVGERIERSIRTQYKIDKDWSKVDYDKIKKQKKIEWDTLEYSSNQGGSGGSMRAMCIGLAFYGKKNREKLIEIAIESGRITHNGTVGFLGALTSALFTAYAVEEIPIYIWSKKLIKLLEDGNRVDKYIKKSRPNEYDNYKKDSKQFIDNWNKYIDLRFTGANFKTLQWMRYPHERTKFYYENFGYKKDNKPWPGQSGDDSVIIAYDCLLDCEGSWEKLIYYSMTHSGDSDTTGSIAGAWFGAVYGFKDVPKTMISNLEFKNELIKLGKDLFKKYYKE